MCKRRVTGMHYETRVQCVRDWHADRRIWMTKDEARQTLMAPWQYLQNPPQYVGSDRRCFLAMVMWWTPPQYLKKHEEAKKRREDMGGGSHIQGSIPLALHIQREETAIGVKPSLFGMYQKMKTRKTPHPKKGSMWINDVSKVKCERYITGYKEKHGENSNPLTEEFDLEVAVLAGEGLKHGRLWIGDRSVDPMTIPSLRQAHSGCKSGGPQVQTHPRASNIAIDRLQAKMEAREQRI